MNEKNKKEYNKFMNKQFKLLEGHFQRIMLRCYNKFMELKSKELTKGEKRE